MWTIRAQDGSRVHDAASLAVEPFRIHQSYRKGVQCVYADLMLAGI
jgi:hypothetical protein